MRILGELFHVSRLCLSALLNGHELSHGGLSAVMKLVKLFAESVSARFSPRSPSN
jgi:hypothetical protein